MLELLLMDEDVQKVIKQLIKYAEKNTIDYERMVNISKSNIQHPVLNDKNFEAELPNNIRVVFSIEEHPVGMCKHISISQDLQLPIYEDILLVLSYFGFKSKLGDSKVSHDYLEDCLVDGKECSAINVIERVIL
jgi:hypothetical protein